MFSKMWKTVMDLLTRRMSTCEEGVRVEESEVAILHISSRGNISASTKPSDAIGRQNVLI